MRDRALALALLLAASIAPARAGAADNAPPLTLAQAVTIASGGSPTVQLAGLKADEARARIGVARGALLPSLSGNAFELNRTFNSRTLGLSFPSAPGTPGIPTLI